MEAALQRLRQAVVEVGPSGPEPPEPPEPSFGEVRESEGTGTPSPGTSRRWMLGELSAAWNFSHNYGYLSMLADS